MTRVVKPRPCFRRDNARQKIERRLASLDPNGIEHEQITAWLFACGVTTHVLLVAALRNPTVRFRYLAVRDVLRRHGRAEVYEELLDLLGCRPQSRDRVADYLDRLGQVFDTAAARHFRSAPTSDPQAGASSSTRAINSSTGTIIAKPSSGSP